MKRLLRSEHGALTVEFSVTAGILIIMLAMCLEVSRVQIVSMLLERSVYDIAYQSRVARGEGFAAIAQEAVKSRSYGLFSADDVSVEAKYAPDMEVMAAGGYAGAGGAGDIVRLTMTAKISIFGSLTSHPMRITRTIDYFFQNEPGVKY